MLDFNFYAEWSVWEIQIVKDLLVSLVLYHRQVVTFPILWLARRSVLCRYETSAYKKVKKIAIWLIC